MANTKDGKPGVMCKQCRKVLNYLAAAYTGTLSMNKYRKGINCARYALGRPNIRNLLEKAVYYIFIYYLLY